MHVILKSSNTLLFLILLATNLLVNLIIPKGTDQSNRFTGDYVLEETFPAELSSSSEWWLNSGAYLYVADGAARTSFGALDKNSKWRLAYEGYNPASTDGGYYPQNIFRLLTRQAYLDSSQELTFNIDKINLSLGEHRNESNGVLLFMRYLDQDNLYYAGLRVDGAYVIKKKIEGEYTTLAYKQYFSGEYNRDLNPNLLPTNEDLFIKVEIKTLSEGTPHIKLFSKQFPTDAWHLMLEYEDTSDTAIKTSGFNGIRTDFMDVTFSDYKVY